MDEWKRGDSASMSDVVIRSTENGPKPGHCGREGCSGLVPMRRVHADAFLRRYAQEERVHGQNTRGQGPLVMKPH
jgi:hypothetical protein